MSNIFSSDFGGVRTMRSASTDVNLIQGQASMDAQDDKAFANKLKEVQDRANIIKAVPERDPEEDKKLREACQEMEAVFLNMMLSKMRETVPERTLFKKSNGEKIMESMLDVEMTRQMSQGGKFGLANMLYENLTRPSVTRLPLADDEM